MTTERIRAVRGAVILPVRKPKPMTEAKYRRKVEQHSRMLRRKERERERAERLGLLPKTHDVTISEDGEVTETIREALS